MWNTADSRPASKTGASSLVYEEIQDSIQAKEGLARECTSQILEMADVITSALREGRKVVFFGNGGSAADAQHIAAELVGKFATVRPALRALALTTNSSILTAIGNDFGFDQIFARQVAAEVEEGDVVVGISTSGNSKNVLEGIRAANELGAKTIALSGGTGGELAELCDYQVLVPSSNTQRIQECHITIGHIVCRLVEANLTRNPSVQQEAAHSRVQSRARRTRFNEKKTGRVLANSTP